MCLRSTVLVFKLSAYFTLNKEHLNPRFVHELADKLVVRQSHGQGISYEEEEDRKDYGLKHGTGQTSWHIQCSKLLHMINGEHATMSTKGLYSSSAVKWYGDPSILYEELQVNGSLNISLIASSLSDLTTNSYVQTILPMASQKVAKVAKGDCNEVVAMAMPTPSTVMVYHGGTGFLGSVEKRVGLIVTEIIVCKLDSKEYSNCKWVWLLKDSYNCMFHHAGCQRDR